MFSIGIISLKPQMWCQVLENQRRITNIVSTCNLIYYVIICCTWLFVIKLTVHNYVKPRGL